MKTFLFLLLATATYGQQVINGSRVIAGTVNYCADVGANDTYACTITGLTAYATGGEYAIKANTANTGGATVNLTALGAVTIVKREGGVTTPLADNDIRAGQIIRLSYDGTNMQCSDCNGNAPVGGGGALTSNAGDAPFWLWGGPMRFLSGTAFTANGEGSYWGFANPISMQFRKAFISVSAAGVAGKGAVLSVYTRASSGDLTRIAITDGFLADSTGNKYPVWSSGSAVSAGVLTLPAGQNLVLSLTVDASAGTAPSFNHIDESEGTVGMVTEGLAVKSIASQTGASTGTGTSVVSPASVVGSSLAAANRYHPYVIFLP